MRVNVAPRPAALTHEGAPAKRINAEQQLRRSVLSCLLWEKEFYEDGQSIAERIVEAAHQSPPAVVASLAVEARTQFHLRHVPLLLLTALASHPKKAGGLREAVAKTIQRADEMAELLAIYWKDGKKPLPAGFKRGIADAFVKFSRYQLAKYNRDGAIKLRDVLFLTHPKPTGEEQAETFKMIAENRLPAPDTWEVALSAGEDKKATFERLLAEEKLGYLALLRNLRNMTTAGVSTQMIRMAILERKGADRVLPFRYIAAARACPQLEPEIDLALQASIADLPRLPGKTLVLVDVSGSMDATLSGKSDMTRADAAAGLASILNCEELRVFSFSNGAVEVPPRRGLAGVDAILRSQAHGGTDLRHAVMEAAKIPHDRLIVITDEQSATPVPDPVCKHAYMVNVASYKNGVGYGRWTHIDGFSENVIRYIVESESCL